MKTATKFILACAFLALLPACSTIQPEHTWFLFVGETKRGEIRPGEFHTYSLTVEKSGPVIIDLVPDFPPAKKQDSAEKVHVGSSFRQEKAAALPVIDPSLTLLTDRGVELDRNDDCGEGPGSRVVRLLERGRYRLVVKGAGDTWGRYVLTATGTDGKNAIVPGKTVDAKIGSLDTHTYRLTAPKTGRIDLDFTITADTAGSTASPAALNVYFMLLSGDGVYMDKAHANIKYPRTRMEQYVIPGNYIVYTRWPFALAGRYSLNAAFSEILTQPFTDISVGQERDGFIIPKTTHTYSLTMNKSQLVVIRHQALGTSKIEPVVRLESPMFRNSVPEDIYTSNPLTSQIAAYLMKGNYAVIAGERGGSYGTYRVSVQGVTPVRLEARRNIVATVAPDRLRSYVFTIPKDSFVSLSAKPQGRSPESLRMDLHTESGEYIGSASRNYGGRGAEFIINQNLKKGEYHLTVGATHRGGSYVVSYRKVEIEPVIMNPIQPGQRRTGCIHISGTREEYTLDLAKDAKIEIRANDDNSSFNPYVEIMDAGGFLIAFDDDSGYGMNALLARELKKGLYKIAVRGSGNSTGCYSLTVEKK